MTRDLTPAGHAATSQRAAVCRAGVLAASGVALLAAIPVQAAEIKTSGRITAGIVTRVQARDPDLLTGVNAAAIGLNGRGSGGNADDANTNYGKGDAVSRAVKALFEVSAVDGNWSALLRTKAWYDAGLIRDGRPWGNVANGYAPGAPLSDRGAPRLSRFSGVALLDAWVQGRFAPGEMPLLLRLGRQTTP